MYTLPGWSETPPQNQWQAGVMRSPLESPSEYRVQSRRIELRRAADNATISIGITYEGDYAETKDWIPSNACIYEGRRLADVPSPGLKNRALRLVGFDRTDDGWTQLMNRIGTTLPWTNVEGTVDAIPHTFEMVRINTSFAGLTRLRDGTILSLYSRGASLPDLTFVTWNETSS